MAVAMGNAAIVEDLRRRYIVPQNAREIQRLTDQHEWVKGNMGGALIKAPININRCKAVLDSATADGMLDARIKAMHIFERTGLINKRLLVG
jgi:hypothetical protein